MASMSIAICSFIFASFLEPVVSRGFLKPQFGPRGSISKSELEQAILFQLEDHERHARVKAIEAEMRPLFMAMPKNEHGLLDPSVVRYALHRYFVHKHGWHVTGLEPHTTQQNSSSPLKVMKDRVPTFIESYMFERLHMQGLGLHELAAFAVVLADLVRSENVGNLHGVFAKLDMDTSISLSTHDMDLVTKSYVIDHFSQMNPGTGSRNASFAQIEKALDALLFSWGPVVEWSRDLLATLEFTRLTRRNPFAKDATYSDAEEFAQEFGYQFTAFQNIECHSLKEHLMNVEFQGTGRVRLAEFYSSEASSSESEWDLVESVDYLRDLGALDESDPSHPSVIIPNFVGSRSNCLFSSSYYAVCCMDECEGLMASLERVVQSSDVAPGRIASVISALPSETVEAPRNLSMPLLRRLDEIAALHHGQVPLHGRLFAQWMHHAYPRECPYPHASGTTNPLSKKEWALQFGDAEADDAVMRAHAANKMDKDDLAFAMTPEAKMEAMPWIEMEELVIARPSAKHGAASSLRSSLQLAGFMAFVASLLKMVFTQGGAATSIKTRAENHFV